MPESKITTHSNAVEHLSAFAKDTIIRFDLVDKNNIAVLLDEFRKLKLVNDALEASIKLLKEIETNLSYSIIPDTLENLGMDSVKSKGYLYSLGVRVNASIPLDQQEKGFEWLKTNGLSAIIKETVNAKTLSASIKSYTDIEGKQPPEDAIKIHRQRYISVRKA